MVSRRPFHSSSRAWDQAANVLAVRLDALGDVLMTTPALAALKEALPGRQITLLTSPAGAAVAALLPVVDEWWTYDAPWMKATAARVDSRPEFALVDRLRRGRFDAAVIFTVYSQNPLPAALLCQLADIPLRLAHCHENPYQLLTDWVPDPEPQRLVRHEVRRQLDLVGHVGCRTSDERLALRVPSASRRAARAALREAGIDPSRPWILVHPGASAPSRRYAPEAFAEVCHRLVRDHGLQVLLTASGSEGPLVLEIQAAMESPCPALVGGLPLAGFAALVAQAPLLLANNSGPVHVAAAVGTPVVDLYALTNPQHTPWGVPHRVLSYDVPCKYCYKSVCPEGHHDCLRRVPPQAVVEAVLELLADSADHLAAATNGRTPLPLVPLPEEP